MLQFRYILMIEEMSLLMDLMWGMREGLLIFRPKQLESWSYYLLRCGRLQEIRFERKIRSLVLVQEISE